MELIWVLVTTIASPFLAILAGLALLGGLVGLTMAFVGAVSVVGKGLDSLRTERNEK